MKFVSVQPTATQLFVYCLFIQSQLHVRLEISHAIHVKQFAFHLYSRKKTVYCKEWTKKWIDVFLFLFKNQGTRISSRYLIFNSVPMQNEIYW